jgi:GTP cyclohydrolase IA
MGAAAVNKTISLVLFEKVVEKAYRDILQGLKDFAGLDPEDENFKGTPTRVARAYGEILSGLFTDGVDEILAKTFPSKSREMITQGPIQVWSVCPHHFLPVDMRVWLAYIPDKKVLGLSKLARIAEIVAKKPALQEDTTCEIVQTLQKGLKPMGAACIIKGRHLCMEMRGIKKAAITTTTSLEGWFVQQPEVRAEFLAAVRGDR